MGALAGKKAIVTGASSGIGAATAKALAREGAIVAVGARRLERPAELAEDADPGLVESNFSRVRFRGDEETAAKVYEGVEALTPEDVAECVVFALTRPPHVNVDELVVKALAQSSTTRIIRES